MRWDLTQGLKPQSPVAGQTLVSSVSSKDVPLKASPQRQIMNVSLE